MFGILKRNGKVYTVMVQDSKTDTLLPVIKRKTMPDSILYTDSYKSYDVLDVDDFTHHRINHSQLLQTAKTTSASSKTFGIRQSG